MAIQKPPRYSDFTLDFLAHPVTGDLARVTDIEDVKRSVRNLVLTNKYERLLDPNCGCNINLLLFDPLDGRTASVISNYVRETITNYEPRAILKNVVCSPDYNNNAFLVTISFMVTMSSTVQTVSVFLQRVR